MVIDRFVDSGVNVGTEEFTSVCQLEVSTETDSTSEIVDSEALDISNDEVVQSLTIGWGATHEIFALENLWILNIE